VAAEEGGELVAGAGEAGRPNRVSEQPRPGTGGNKPRGDRQQDRRQARRDWAAGIARDRDAQTWTVISRAPAAVVMLTVTWRSPMATRRSPGPAEAQVASSLDAWQRRPLTGSAQERRHPALSPGPTPPAVIASRSTPIESLT